MSYLVLARKYRPQTFDEVYAQNHITNILKNAIELDRIAQAYLFTGPRGVGKTSLARIYAKSLNCLENGPTATPCNKCQNCREITSGISTDVLEIDGASNTGVDDIRDLQKELMYSPTNSNYKIYIIDEVHMLSKNAFNALLKTLEEPPPKVIFIFATTEPHKILPTIISRCQRFDFKRIPTESIISRLKDICLKEEITAENEALFLIAKKADGSMRDAESLLDQVIAYSKDNITYANVLTVFGIVSDNIFDEILENISLKNSAKIIKLLHSVLEKGNDVQEFLNGFLDYIRNLILIKIGVEVQIISIEKAKKISELGKKFSENDLLYLVQLLIKIKTDVKNSDNQILVAEMGFVKISKLAEMQSIEALLEKVEDVVTSEVVMIKEPEYIQKKTQTTIIPELPKTVEKPKMKVENLTIEAWKNNKKVIVNKLKIMKAILANYLDSSEINDISNNVIHFIVGSNLALGMLKKEKEKISKIISEHFGNLIRVEFSYEKKEIKNVEPTFENIKDKSPAIANFIDKTDSIVS